MNVNPLVSLGPLWYRGVSCSLQTSLKRTYGDLSFKHPGGVQGAAASRSAHLRGARHALCGSRHLQRRRDNGWNAHSGR